jgi:hypothetical protein
LPLSSTATLLLLPLLAGPPAPREVVRVDDPEGLSGLLALRTRLIAAHEMTRSLTWIRGQDFHLLEALSHRAEVLDSKRQRTREQRWAVELRLKYLGPQSWKAEQAELVDPGGRLLKVLAVRQEKPLGQRERGTVVVEVECPEGAPPSPYVLTVWGEGQQPSFTLAGVRFP